MQDFPKYKSTEKGNSRKVGALQIKTIVRDAGGANRPPNGSAVVTFEEEGYEEVKLLNNWLYRNRISEGGYLVKDEKGNMTFSDKESFEAAYKAAKEAKDETKPAE